MDAQGNLDKYRGLVSTEDLMVVAVGFLDKVLNLQAPTDNTERPQAADTKPDNGEAAEHINETLETVLH
jgi:hypothetical protein